MKNLNIRQSFKSNKFKYGGYATLLTAVVIIILMAVNLVVDQISFKIDLTENQLYSLSDQTHKVLDGLNEEVRIIGLYQTGRENKQVIEILDRYQRSSKNVTLTIIDPIKNPQRVMEYQTDGGQLDLGSIIVESDSKFKVIGQMDLYNISTDQYSAPKIQSLAVEQRLTGALVYVTTDELPVVYTLKGHNEDELSAQLKKQFDIENYTIQDLDLMTVDEVPEDAHALLVVSPKRDLQPEEQERLSNYLVNEGRAIFLMDFVKDELPNFQKVLGNYGVQLQRGLIVEGERKNHAGNPIWLLPNVSQHEISAPLSTGGLRVFVPMAQGVGESEVKRHSLKVEPLLTTSANSWAKVNMNAQTPEKEEGDLEGPFNVAVAVSEAVFEDDRTKQTKLVVVGNGVFLNPQFTGYGNEDFLMNSLNWLRERQESISIRPKSLVEKPLSIDALQQLIWAGVAVILIPLIVLSMGLAVWLRRRHL